ncbi:MAG: hypothetical protein KatS3mg102_1835 [Planctomycetota bacterium]|nr:MAG: hypothetical protein KatS3mg102_1835 [Planctomycetota bacterium]
MVIALHGNPGTGADLEPLAARLGAQGPRVVVPSRPPAGAPLEELVAELDRLALEAEQLCLLGYSWGCYLALRYARLAARPPAAIVLVNPYLVAQNPLSPLVPVALGLPLLGRLLVRGVAAKAPAFIETVFAPEPPPAETAAALRARLADPVMWRGAVRYKLLQQREPLAALAQPPARMLVVRGSADRVADWQVQQRPLAGILPRIEIEEVPGAGHGLPWTRTAELARRIADWLAAG